MKPIILPLKILIPILLLFFSIQFGIVFADSENKTEILLNAGIDYLKIEKYDEAISYFDKVLEIDENNVSALSNKGDILVKLEKYQEAISNYNHALKVEPNNPDILSSKGMTLINLNKTQDAIASFDMALGIDPNHIDSLNGKGIALTNQEKYDEAISYFDKALEIVPDDFDTLFNKADSFRAQQNYDEAYSYFYQLLKMQPDDFLTQSKIKIVHTHMNFTDFDGFIETTIHNSQGNLVAHLKINTVTAIDHQIVNEMIDDWNLIKTINRDGIEYEVRQHEKIIKEGSSISYHGGATHYGLNLIPDERKTSLIRADYWFYQTEKGDTISTVITAFRPVV